MKKSVLPALLLFLFLSTLTLLAQTPEAPANVLPPSPVYVSIDNYIEGDVLSRIDRMMLNNIFKKRLPKSDITAMNQNVLTDKWLCLLRAKKKPESLSILHKP